MIDIIITPHWRETAVVNPGHKNPEDIKQTRVQRFTGFTLQSKSERIARRDSGRYPTNVFHQGLLEQL